MKAKTKKVRLAHGKLQGRRLTCIGGPWDNEHVFIPAGGTMVIRLGPYHGHYASSGEWRDVRPT